MLKVMEEINLLLVINVQPTIGENDYTVYWKLSNNTGFTK